jgi:peptidoglycan hydrolase-like protein with peptidoglycan-binding domain
MMRALLPNLVSEFARLARLTKEEQMKKILSTFLSLIVVSAIATAAQNTNSSTTTNTSTTKTARKRGPIFRANKDQVKQAQAILKTRGFYSGEQTGKLDADVRAGLKKYQAAETLKVTGTLNKVTLEKMGIALTDKQKVM